MVLKLPDPEALPRCQAMIFQTYLADLWSTLLHNTLSTILCCFRLIREITGPSHSVALRHDTALLSLFISIAGAEGTMPLWCNQSLLLWYGIGILHGCFYIVLRVTGH